MKCEAIKNCSRLKFTERSLIALVIFILCIPVCKINAGQSRKYLDNEIIYQVVLDRFHDGLKANNFFRQKITLADYSIPQDPKGLYDPKRESMVSRFGGDIRGLIEKLDYLRELGVTVLWVSPVFKNANELIPEYKGEYSFNTNYHGYWIEDWHEVDPHLQGINQRGFEAVAELVQEASRRGIKIMLDTVINHSNHYGISKGRILRNGKFIVDADTDKEKPKEQRWFHHAGEIPLNWDTSDRSEKTKTYRLANLADLNPENNDDVFDYLLEAHLELLSLGVYGFRVDTIPYVDESVIARFERELRKHYPDVVLVGEWFAGGPTKTASMGFYENTDYSMFNFDLRWVFQKGFVNDNEGYRYRNFRYLIYNVSNGFDDMYKRGMDPNDMVTFVDNHDVPRLRDLMELAGLDDDAAKRSGEASMAMLFSLPGVPCLLYGIEHGLYDKGKHDSSRREGHDPYNRPMMFADDGSLMMRDDALFEKTQQLIELRKNYPVLRYGSFFNLDGQLRREKGGEIKLVSRERGVWVNKCGRDRAYGFVREDSEHIVFFMTNVADESCTVWMDHHGMGLDPAHARLAEMIYPDSRRIVFESARHSIENPSIKRTAFNMAPFDYLIMVFKKGEAYVSHRR